MNLLEGIVEGEVYDKAVDKFNDIAGNTIRTKDPYRETLAHGSTRKLKLPSNATKEEAKSWKKVQRRAWLDDKCFLGCYPVDCGCGLGPIVVILPVIGPYLMYMVHMKLIQIAVTNFNIDAKTQAKLHANILFDLLITLPPVIGSFFSWLNGCSTRNAAIVHTSVSRELVARMKVQQQISASYNKPISQVQQPQQAQVDNKSSYQPSYSRPIIEPSYIQNNYHIPLHKHYDDRIQRHSYTPVIPAKCDSTPDDFYPDSAPGETYPKEARLMDIKRTTKRSPRLQSLRKPVPSNKNI